MKRHLILLFFFPVVMLFAQGMERTDGTMSSLSPMVVDGIMEHTDGTKPSIKTDWNYTATTALLLHMNGTDESTTFTDSGATGHTVTANGDAQIDTAQSKFGGASGLFDGTGDYLSIPDHADWTPSGDFTLDMWVRANALPGAGANAFLFEHFTDSSNRWNLVAYNNGGTQQIVCNVISAGSTIVQIIGNSGISATDTWYHVALVRSGNLYVIYVDGVAKASGVDSDAIPNFTNSVYIGQTIVGGDNEWNGWIDELRYIKGTAAFNPSTFTVPAAAY